MIRSFVTLFMFLLAVSVTTADAETYTWTDEQGTVHFTEDLGTVPQKFRNKLRTMEESDSSPEEKPASKVPPAITPEAAPRAILPAGKGESGPTELYAGKTYAQWEKDITDQEAAMTSVRKRIDEVAATLNNYPNDWNKQKEVLQEHQSLVKQFKGMKTHYLEQVEIARKAGFPINIQQQ